MTFPTTPPLRYAHEVGIRAARAGHSIHKWDDSITGLSTEHVVSTDAALYYDLPEGYQVMVTALVVGLDTINDEVHAYVAGCAAIAGGGDDTQLSHHIHYVTAVGKAGRSEVKHVFDPPLCVKYSDGYRSVSVAIAANDTDADVLVAWHGWVEREIT